MTRTPEQIQQQLEEAFDALVAEAERRKADPLLNFPCSTCDHGDGAWCNNALVKGFKDRAFNHDVYNGDYAKLCGPEKALWEPKQFRLIEWGERFFTDSLAGFLLIVFGPAAALACLGLLLM